MATDLKKFEISVTGKRETIADYTDVIVGAGDYKRILNINVLIKSLSNLLLTPLGSYPFDPEYGSELYKKVWELDDSEISNEIRYEVIERVKLFDPRIIIQDVIIEYYNTLKGYRVDVLIKYDGDTSKVQLDYDQSDFFGME